MPYTLPTPLTPEEADELSTQHAFRREFKHGAIFAEFDDAAQRDAAFQTLRASRMALYRESLKST